MFAVGIEIYLIVVVGLIISLIRIFRRPETCIEYYGSNLLIIDGCNGPLKLNKTDLFDDFNPKSNCAKRIEKSIILMRMKSGTVSQNEFVHPLQNEILKNLFRNHVMSLGNIAIYFDGRGMKMVENREATYRFNEKQKVDIRVTRKDCEVDNVVVDIVKDRRRNLTSTPIQTPVEHLKIQASLLSGEEPVIFNLTRNDRGPGKARILLKPYCLVRPTSVYSLPCITPKLKRRSIADMNVLLGIKSTLNHFQSHAESRVLAKDSETFVITDDVHFRQRVVEAGGIVLTFEQLWFLLQE